MPTSPGQHARCPYALSKTLWAFAQEFGLPREEVEAAAASSPSFPASTGAVIWDGVRHAEYDLEAVYRWATTARNHLLEFNSGPSCLLLGAGFDATNAPAVNDNRFRIRFWPGDPYGGQPLLEVYLEDLTPRARRQFPADWQV